MSLQDAASMRTDLMSFESATSSEEVIESEVKVDLRTGHRAVQYLALAPPNYHAVNGDRGDVDGLSQTQSGVVIYDNILDSKGRAKYLPRHVLDFRAESDEVNHNIAASRA